MQAIWTSGRLALPSVSVAPMTIAMASLCSEGCSLAGRGLTHSLTNAYTAFDGWAYTQERAHGPHLGHSQHPQLHTHTHAHPGMHAHMYICMHTYAPVHMPEMMHRCRQLDRQERVRDHTHHGGRARLSRKNAWC